MITENLYQEVLLRPLSEGADSLYIVSGYASAAMTFHFLNQAIREVGRSDLQVDLVVGMTPKDGISIGNHTAFKALMDSEFNGHLRCSYACDCNPIHSKVYAWKMGMHPQIAFAGSANFSQNAFRLMSQKECMTACDPEVALNYFSEAEAQSIFCNHPDVMDHVCLHKHSSRQPGPLQPEENGISTDYSGLPSVELSLLDSRTGETPTRSGLNWGQRDGREPNQAYLNIPAEICRRDFFPPRGTHFSVLTDDGKTLICVRAQDNGKGIETPHNNSLIGEYFRYRLGLANGAYVAGDDLIRYGRTSVRFYKIDDENFYMDFSST